MLGLLVLATDPDKTWIEAVCQLAKHHNLCTLEPEILVQLLRRLADVTALPLRRVIEETLQLSHLEWQQCLAMLTAHGVDL